MKQTVVTLFGLAALVLPLVACGNKSKNSGNNSAAQKTETAVNKEETTTDSIVFPDFTQTDINGKQVSLHKAISKNVVTLIDFWASWCGPVSYTHLRAHET